MALEAAPALGVQGDRELLRRAVENILRNAIRYAPEGTAIRVSRGDDPRLLARDGLVGLGFSLQEADELLDGAEGATPEDLIANALKATRS